MCILLGEISHLHCSLHIQQKQYVLQTLHTDWLILTVNKLHLQRVVMHMMSAVLTLKIHQVLQLPGTKELLSLLSG